jgi:parallel beta helix pectate lyase-like protein
VYCDDSSPKVTNCTIAGNSAFMFGSGMSCSRYSSPTLTNCTIAENSGPFGGGVYCDRSSPTFVNCILWNDSADEVHVDSGIPTVSYSNIQGGWTGAGNIDEDPLFVRGWDGVSADVHLQLGPPVSIPETRTQRTMTGAFRRARARRATTWAHMEDRVTAGDQDPFRRPPQPQRPLLLPLRPNTPTQTLTPTHTATPTERIGAGCDSGYYVLDSFGGRHRVGNPYVITGPVYFGEPIARDMERAVCDPTGAASPNLVVLDGFGGAHFVTGPNCDIQQDFYFGDISKNEFPDGRAVDLEMSSDSLGF